MSLLNCQSFNSGFGDDRFVLLHYFGDKFSVGAVNFHSVWRLIVGYLTERSMWRNFDNSEHLLGLTEGHKSVPNSILTLMKKRNFSCLLGLRECTIHTLHMKISRCMKEFINVAVLRFDFIFLARSTFKFFEKTPPPKLWGTKWVHDFFGQTRKGGREQY